VRRVAAVVVLIGIEVATFVLVLHLGAAAGFAVDWSDPAGWLAQAAPEDALAAIVRLVTLVAIAWLLASTILAATLPRRPGTRSAALIRAITAPGAARLLERVLAVSLVTGTTLGPALAAGAGAPPPTAEVEIDVRSGRADAAPPPPVEPTTVPEPAPTPAPLPAPAPPVEELAVHAEHVVAPGESLWSIAADELARTTARPTASIADAEIAAYWVEVMAANHGRLASSDPNLIFPGETILLPR
jgi:hypothetical protein